MEQEEKNILYNLIAELQENAIAMGEDLQRTKAEIFFLKARLYDILLTMENKPKNEVKK